MLKFAPMGVLHPWTSALASPPPGHALVPGGALSPEGAPGRAPRWAAWLVPVRARSALVRSTCQAARTPAGLYTPVPPQGWHKPGVTHGTPAGTGTAGRTSCAPSLSRLARTTNRVDTRADGSGTCRVTPRSGARGRRLTRPAAACLPRVLQHVRPQGFLNGRAYGFLSPRRRTGLPHHPCACAWPPAGL